MSRTYFHPSRQYMVNAASGAANPADANFLYYGALTTHTASAVAGSSAAIARLYIPQDGRIIEARTTIYVAATAGSTETGTIAIRVDNTTDHVIHDPVSWDVSTTAVKHYENAALSIDVTSTQYVMLKVTCPTWATNPTTVFFNTQLVVDR